MSSEIKVVIKKGGKTLINDKDVTNRSASFTKALADTMGETVERHLDVGLSYTTEEENQTESQH